jgi:7-cyano-7-deazaguanine synthase
MRRAFVLLSGGIDSTTCLYKAWSNDEWDRVEGVSLFYGQRHRKEIEYARRSCAWLGIPHHTLDVSSIVPRTMLTDPAADVPSISYGQITGVSPTYVPYRNGLLLSAVTSFVVGKRLEAIGDVKTMWDPAYEWGIYFGAHAEDAQNWAYPDCTPEFIGAQANAIYTGTYGGIRLHTPLEWLNKREIIQLGESLGVRWQDTWSCYKGEALHCGTCPTCRARRDGFVAAGVKDPTEYAAAVAA